MNLKIDLKSALAGLGVGVLAMFVIGAAGSSSNPVGRYAVAAGTSFAIVVDTATGQAWTQTSPGFLEKKVDK